MVTHPEDLSNELWIEVFDYLPIHDIFQGFSNLNKYFDDILASKYLSFKVELKAEGNDNDAHLPTFYLSDAICSRIICLKSSINFSYDYFPEFFQNHGTKFTRLESLLIKANTKEIPSICLALQQLNTLRYLSLSCIPNQNLLENILASRSLRKCRLDFWRVTTPINHYLGIDSGIEILYIKLKDDTNHSILNLLLSHMPKLKKLEIVEENFINDNSHPLFNQQLFTFSNLEILKIKWGYYDIQLNSFQYLFTVMPNLKYLYFTMFYYTLDRILNNNLINCLWLIFKKMKPIKITILCRRLMNTTENNVQTIFNNYCQQLLQTINSRSNTPLQVKWFEKNQKIHKIEMNFKEF
jgi:hypothetical protein